MDQERRRFQREKHRISCEFTIHGQRHQGILSNLSANGLFVQCSAPPAEDQEVSIILRDVALGEIQLRGIVQRIKASHRSITIVEPGGFSVAIHSAPERYFQLLIQLGLG